MTEGWRGWMFLSCGCCGCYISRAYLLCELFLSFCPSVCIMTKRMNLLPVFRYHMKSQSVFFNASNGWWGTSFHRKVWLEMTRLLQTPTSPEFPCSTLAVIYCYSEVQLSLVTERTKIIYFEFCRILVHIHCSGRCVLWRLWWTQSDIVIMGGPVVGHVVRENPVVVWTSTVTAG